MSGRSRSLYLFIRRVIKQTAVIIEAHHLCQLRTKFYPASCCQVYYLRKKWEYNEVVHQLFIDMKKAYDSVRRDVLYNILIQIGIPVKLEELIKTCLNESYSRV